MTHLASIPRLHHLGSLSHQTFAAIFARNVLKQLSPAERETTLREWSSYLTPGTGPIVVSLGLNTERLGEVANAVAVNSDTEQVVERMSHMLDTEWVAGEEALRRLIDMAGLEIRAVQRVGFESSSTWEWMGQSSMVHDHGVIRHSQCKEKGDMNAD